MCACHHQLETFFNERCESPQRIVVPFRRIESHTPYHLVGSEKSDDSRKNKDVIQHRLVVPCTDRLVSTHNRFLTQPTSLFSAHVVSWG
jgi:hypothetical protein